MGQTKTTEQFIEDAIKVHGDWYDYSKVEYKSAREEIIIVCPIHGEFNQLPTNHLKGKECKYCASTKRGEQRKYDTKKFIEKAKEVHCDWYDYSKVEYKNAHTKVTIICPEHGEFTQKPGNHLHGQTCLQCANIQNGLSKSNNKNDFIKRAKEVHNNKYDYSKTEYKNAHTKLIIACPVHGDFKQKPNAHLSGKGCPECADENRRVWNPKFIRNYRSHIKDNPCTLYVTECYSENERFIKVGITTKTVEERYKYSNYNDYYQYHTLYEYHSTLIECSEIEQEVLKYFKEHKYEPMNKFGGSSECLQYTVLNDILLKIKELEEQNNG